MTTATPRDLVRHALRQHEQAAAKLRAVLRDPDATDEQIAAALARCAGHARVAVTARRSEEEVWKHE
jgi:ketol-acid reductoisomerase